MHCVNIGRGGVAAKCMQVQSQGSLVISRVLEMHCQRERTDKTRLDSLIRNERASHIIKRQPMKTMMEYRCGVGLN